MVSPPERTSNEAGSPAGPELACATQLTLTAVTGLPRIEPGDDLAQLLCRALTAQALVPAHGDVIAVSSKLVAKAEDRYVDLSQVTPSPQAQRLAAESGKDPRFVEIVLWDTQSLSRTAKNVLIVRHGGGHVSANAGIDQSNARPARARAGTGPWVLRLPRDPDESARRLRDRITEAFQAEVGVILTDSFGRPFRQGTVGAAIGVAGFPALFDQRGRQDLDGRSLEATITAPADQLAATCDLVMGQAAEARGAVHVRGLRFTPSTQPATAVCRPAREDLYL